MTEGVLDVIKLHFANKHKHPVELLEVENISFDGKNYILDFSLLNVNSNWERKMWGVISHSEVIEDMRDYKINQLDI
jgi:hypothetical protein